MTNPTGKQPPTGTTGNTGNTGDYSFKCADAGYKECNWQTSGRSEDEVIRNVEPHARQAHNITHFDDSIRNKVRSNIQRQAA